ncbi:hypothetical protein ACH4PU_30685 [Streptomyces sp. NPDC021100]|uniref:hypothetical protein n=1 Tax=Streptomyces sp. NPDC021100 TaxID=3365114 RepID=UPI0037B5C3F3
MLTNPSIRCPLCSRTDLEVSLVRYSGGGKDVTSFTCHRCRYTWEPFETPHFGAPDYATAYAGAPVLMEEELALVLLAEGIKARAEAALTGNGPRIDSGDHRLVLLRKAAWLDRGAREVELGWFCGRYTDDEVNRASTTAERAAAEFMTFDREHGEVHVIGLHGPDAPQWDTNGGPRAYIRQEYKEWLDWEREAADRREMLPHRGADGELYGPDGRAL